MKVGVVGLGYVGAAVSWVMADAGLEVVGVDINSERLALTHIPELVFESGRVKTSQSYDILADCEIVLIAVETSLGAARVPNYTRLIAASRTLGQILASGTLVIVESTVGPKTCEEVVRPALESHGRWYRLGHCPERLAPGSLVYNLRNMARICGGDSFTTSLAMVEFYGQFLGAAKLYPADLVTAELVKTLENAFRDMQLAFSNEAAQICEIFGGDVWRIRELVNTAPGRLMLEPGPGVGGACIPKDPWLLMGATKQSWTLLEATRRVNDNMPTYVASWIKKHIQPPARLGILGLAYRENTTDTRFSPAIELGSALIRAGFTVIHYDPVVYPKDSINKFNKIDALVLATKHDAFKDLPWSYLINSVEQKLFFDTKDFLTTVAWQAGFKVHVLGWNGLVEFGQNRSQY